MAEDMAKLMSMLSRVVPTGPSPDCKAPAAAPAAASTAPPVKAPPAVESRRREEHTGKFFSQLASAVAAAGSGSSKLATSPEEDDDDNEDGDDENGSISDAVNASLKSTSSKGASPSPQSSGAAAFAPFRSVSKKTMKKTKKAIVDATVNVLRSHGNFTDWVSSLRIDDTTILHELGFLCHLLDFFIAEKYDIFAGTPYLSLERLMILHLSHVKRNTLILKYLPSFVPSSESPLSVDALGTILSSVKDSVQIT